MYYNIIRLHLKWVPLDDAKIKVLEMTNPPKISQVTVICLNMIVFLKYIFVGKNQLSFRQLTIQSDNCKKFTSTAIFQNRINESGHILMKHWSKVAAIHLYMCLRFSERLRHNWVVNISNKTEIIKLLILILWQVLTNFCCCFY